MDPGRSRSTKNNVLVVNGSDRTTHKDPIAPTLSGIIDGDKIKEDEPSMGLGNASDNNVVELLNVRQRDNHNAVSLDSAKTTMSSSSLISPLIWSWPHEHADRKCEREADEALHGRHGSAHYIYGSHSMPFEVDRKLLKDLVREKMGEEVGRIEFLSAGMSPCVSPISSKCLSRFISQGLLGNPHFTSDPHHTRCETIYASSQDFVRGCNDGVSQGADKGSSTTRIPLGRESVQ